MSSVRRRSFCPALLLLAACGGAEPAREGWFALSDATPEFRHDSGAAGRYELPEIMGGGAAWVDLDGDGRLEIYLVDGAGPNRLFRLDARGKYAEVPGAAGLGDTGYGMGVAVGDVDADGDPDLYLTNDGADRLFVNDGGRFRDASERWGVDVDGWSTSATFVDYDVDGDLDLFVARYVRQGREKSCTDATGRPDYCQPQLFSAATDVLLRNVDGRFEDVSLATGIAAGRAPGLGVVSDDWNRDGWPDLFVANDGAANHLWLNDGDGGFRDEALTWGVAYNLSGEAEAGMGVLSEDFDGDGLPEILLTHLGGETHTLYRRDGASRTFEDRSAEFGLARASLASTGFGMAAGDFDRDGDLDLAVANGRVTRRPPTAGQDPGEGWQEFAEADQLWVNESGRLLESPERTGELDRTPGISRVMLAADYDGDGDLDLLRTEVEGPATLFDNVVPSQGRWLRVDVRLGGGRWHEPGVTVELLAGSLTMRRSSSSSAGYLSAGDGRVHFGVPRSIAPESARIRVRWPGGSTEEFPVVQWDRNLTLVKGRGEPVP